MIAPSSRYRVDIARYEAWLSALPLTESAGSNPFTAEDVVTVGSVSSDGKRAYGVAAPAWGVSVEWMPTRFLIKESE